MMLPRPTQTGTETGTSTPGKGLVFSLAGLACIIIGHALVADWRPSPGGNPWLVPVIASSLILACAVLLGLRLRGNTADLTDSVVAGRRRQAVNMAVATLFTSGWGLGFFHAVQWLGLITATCLFTAAGMLALSPQPRRALRVILPLSLTVATVFWLMFTRLAPVMLGDPLLW